MYLLCSCRKFRTPAAGRDTDVEFTDVSSLHLKGTNQYQLPFWSLLFNSHFCSNAPTWKLPVIGIMAVHSVKEEFLLANQNHLALLGQKPSVIFYWKCYQKFTHYLQYECQRPLTKKPDSLHTSLKFPTILVFVVWTQPVSV